MTDRAGIQSMVGVTVIESTRFGVHTDGVDGDAWSALAESSDDPVQSSGRMGDDGEIRTDLRRMEDAADNVISGSPDVRARVRQIAKQYGWILTVVYPDDVEIIAARKRKHADSVFYLLTLTDDDDEEDSWCYADDYCQAARQTVIGRTIR